MIYFVVTFFSDLAFYTLGLFSKMYIDESIKGLKGGKLFMCFYHERALQFAPMDVSD